MVVVIVVCVTFLHTALKAPNKLERKVVGIEVDVTDDLVFDASSRSIFCAIVPRAD